MPFINDVFIPDDEDCIGGEGNGFRIILKGLNPERIVLGAEAVGSAAMRSTVRRATPGSGSVSIARSG